MRCVYGVFGRDFIKQTLICARLAKPYVYGVCTVCLAGTPSYTRSHVHGWPNRTYTVCVYGMFGRDFIKHTLICAWLAKPYVYGVCTVCLAGTPSNMLSHTVYHYNTVHAYPTYQKNTSTLAP